MKVLSAEDILDDPSLGDLLDGAVVGASRPPTPDGEDAGTAQGRGDEPRLSRVRHEPSKALVWGLHFPRRVVGGLPAVTVGR